MSPNSLITAVLAGVALFGVAHVLAWWWLERRNATSTGTRKPRLFDVALGFVANFFDTLGVGSFATTTAAYRLRRYVADEDIPGTLNVGHALPTITQALIFIAAVVVDPVTLIGMIAAAVIGALVGAQVVSGLPRRGVQLGMGIALLVAALLFLLTIFGLVPGGGEAIALSGPRLWIGLVGNFVLGALMSLGIGLYGPCLILVSLLGMSPIAAFPIMMGSCAFLMPAGSLRFRRAAAIRRARGDRSCDWRHTGGAARRLRREVAAARLAALAGGGRGRVRGGGTAALGAKLK